MTIDTSTEAVERLLEDVTPGPWRIKDCDTLGDRCTNYFQEIWNDETDILVTTEVTRAHNDGGAKNMRFIRAARDLVPALLKERDEARARIDELEAFIADFASAKFDSLPLPLVRYPADEPDPVTDAMPVWSWQDDAKELLEGEKK